MHAIKPHGILIIGPTGAGKTPFGKLLEKNSILERVSYHFDFGEQLRSIVQNKKSICDMTENEHKIICEVVEKNALLTDNQLYLAQKILSGFIEKYNINTNTFILLNGFPRHIGQAHYVDDIIDVKMVLHLKCDENTIMNRIMNNVGGDRVNRTDDTVREIKKKMTIYKQKTYPLIYHYQKKNIQIYDFEIDIETQAQDIFHIFEQTIRT